MTREVLKLALEALEVFAASYSDGDEAITAIKAALAQPYPEYDNGFSNGWDKCAERQALAHPATAQAFILTTEIHLTPEQRESLRCKNGVSIPGFLQPVRPDADAKDAEIARLTACLKAANANAEKFEREWYLRGDEIEAMQAQPEPVAWGIVASNTGRICQVTLDADEVAEHKPEHIKPLYPAPPKRQPLTDEQIDCLWLDSLQPRNKCPYDFALAIEAAHGIGENT